jgi:hypothetical protein
LFRQNKEISDHETGQPFVFTEFDGWYFFQTLSWSVFPAVTTQDELLERKG